MTNGETVTLKEHLDNRISALEQQSQDNVEALARQLDREIAATNRLMAEHTSAHDREHAQAAEALERALQVALAQVDAEHRANQQTFDQIQRAADKYEMTVNERFVAANQFRATLTDQTSTFVRRDFIDQVKDTIEKRVEAQEVQLRDEIAKNRARIEDLEKDRRYSDGRVWGISAAVGFAVTILSLVLRFLPVGG